MYNPSFTSHNLDPEKDQSTFDVGIKSSPSAICKKQLKQVYLEGGEGAVVVKALELAAVGVSRNLIELSILGLNVPVKVAGDCYAEFVQTLDSLQEPPAIEITEVAARYSRNVDG